MNEQELTQKQHELYTLIDNKIELQRIQSALNVKCEYLYEFRKILEVLEDKHVLNSSTEDELTKLLIKDINSIISKQITELDQKFLKINKSI